MPANPVVDQVQVDEFGSNLRNTAKTSQSGFLLGSGGA
jgi:hypothetical protein